MCRATRTKELETLKEDVNMCLEAPAVRTPCTPKITEKMNYKGTTYKPATTPLKRLFFRLNLIFP